MPLLQRRTDLANVLTTKETGCHLAPPKTAKLRLSKKFELWEQREIGEDTDVDKDVSVSVVRNRRGDRCGTCLTVSSLFWKVYSGNLNVAVIGGPAARTLSSGADRLYSVALGYRF